jgi:hypothetical protein
MCPTLTPSTSSPKTVLAKGGEVFVLLAGRPAAEDYVGTLTKLEAAMDEAGRRLSFTRRMEQNRRGEYRAISVGVTLGGGSKAGSTQPDVGVF